MAEWSKALDAQLDLIRFWRTSEGAKTANMANVLPAVMHGDFDVDSLQDPEVQDRVSAIGRSTADEFASQLDRGATYWIASEVVRLLEVAAPSLPPVTPRFEDLPHPGGFAFFESPLATGSRVPDVPGMDVDRSLVDSEGIRVMQWAHEGDEVVVVPYFVATSRTDISPTTSYGTPLGAYRWRYGESVVSDDVEGSDGLDKTARVIMAFWLLSQQRIAQAHSQRVARATRRRAERANFEVPEDGIRVVTLRRFAPEAGESPDPAGVDWSHRWIVGGHWRQQWYPTLEDHRPVWIAPYVKGPEHAPLVVKDRVYRFAR